MPPDTQATLDARNASFWDELCGSALARKLGIREASAESLARFDQAYMALYPYLAGYLPADFEGADVLEIGLGFGTLSAEIARRGAVYHGLDIAAGPVDMVRHRLRLAGDPSPDGRVVQGSALEIPFAARRFDWVYTIGCLHHTGDIPRAVSEVHRVLRPGGTAVVMLYHRHSLRRLRKVTLPALLGRTRTNGQVAAMYDTNEDGDAAPHVEYVSRRDVRRMFASFEKIRIDVRNFDDTRFLPRARLLGTVDRVVGLDLYITARK
jgi:SAM-dependent methyltransferase